MAQRKSIIGSIKSAWHLRQMNAARRQISEWNRSRDSSKMPRDYSNAVLLYAIHDDFSSDDKVFFHNYIPRAFPRASEHAKVRYIENVYLRSLMPTVPQMRIIHAEKGGQSWTADGTRLATNPGPMIPVGVKATGRTNVQEFLYASNQRVIAAIVDRITAPKGVRRYGGLFDDGAKAEEWARRSIIASRILDVDTNATWLQKEANRIIIFFGDPKHRTYGTPKSPKAIDAYYPLLRKAIENGQASREIIEDFVSGANTSSDLDSNIILELSDRSLLTEQDVTNLSKRIDLNDDQGLDCLIFLKTTVPGNWINAIKQRFVEPTRPLDSETCAGKVQLRTAAFQYEAELLSADAFTKHAKAIIESCGLSAASEIGYLDAMVSKSAARLLKEALPNASVGEQSGNNGAHLDARPTIIDSVPLGTPDPKGQGLGWGQG